MIVIGHQQLKKEKLGVAPWYNLETNIVPHLINHGLQNYENHDDLQFPFISKGETIKCKLPFNKQITPYFEIEAESRRYYFYYYR